MSLLQPAPETFDLFDDIILLSEGQIVYQGSREHIVDFFKSRRFKCPDRKAPTDFLQEIMIVAIITPTVFSRAELQSRIEDDEAVYIDTLLFGMLCNMFNGFAELSLTSSCILQAPGPTLPPTFGFHSV
ncbi:ATP-binding cassette transporter [Abeliophyllum distichum]|uniref:ATP-binding cassette transporter n=1 Tax=Abeliophyllum distichum TaxID=126358 RepID=A0ABD1Q3N6_9LAMI